MRRQTVLFPLVVSALILATFGCAASQQVEVENQARPGNTLGGVGRLPSTIPEVTFAEGVGDGVVLPALVGPPVADEIDGNRVLMIGDSIFAGLARRHSNEACRQLVPLGWQVAVEAEAGRFAEFGERVARRRGDEGWDVVMVFLGTNYDGFLERYETSMTEIVDRFTAVPVVLVTTSLFRATQNDVNGAIRDLAESRDHVRVIEWEQISRNRSLLSRDRIHPSPDGQVVLTAALAQMLGSARTGEGDCLKSLYTDDSTNPSGPQSGGGGGAVGTTPTSVAPSSTTSTSSAPGSSETSTTSTSVAEPSGDDEAEAEPEADGEDASSADTTPDTTSAS